MNKRGLSDVIVSLIMILLVLVAIGILWLVIYNILKGSEDEASISGLTINLKILGASADVGNNNLKVTVKRNVGGGELSGLIFVLEGNGEDEVKFDGEIKEAQEKVFTISGTSLSEDTVSDIRKISIFPVFLTESGKEKKGNLADVYEIKGFSYSLAGYAGSTSTSGTGSTWVDSINAIGVSDDITSYSILDATSSNYSNSLVVTGFNFASIPAGAEIKGIEVTIRKSISGGIAIDEQVKLVKGGVIVGNNKASSNSWGALSNSSYGSSTDLWGQTWTASDVKSSSFGTAVSAKLTSAPSAIQAHVDSVNVRVYYVY